MTASPDTASHPAPSLAALRREFARLASPRRRAVTLTFFKCRGVGYGERERFAGLSVPQVRGLLRRFRALPDRDIPALVRSRIHEERLLGLLFLVDRYRRGGEAARARVYRTYVASFPWIDNWDLVDASAEHILGAHLESRDRTPLRAWARSPRLWDRRLAVVATLAWIRKGRFAETLRLVRGLLGDPEDLMHKACGWMLREVGKRDLGVLRGFLDRHGSRMPRTMLRYAIERFPERERLAYLAVRGPRRRV